MSISMSLSRSPAMQADNKTQSFAQLSIYTGACTIYLHNGLCGCQNIMAGIRAAAANGLGPMVAAGHFVFSPRLI
jgi:hypothetical protein